MERAITVSGWGQSPDALTVLGVSAYVEYAQHKTIADALAAIAQAAKPYDTIIGWSLGGQLAARATAAGMIAPKKLVLIATPYQFVTSPGSHIGMGRGTFNKFRDNYAKNPIRTLHKAWELVVKGDSKPELVRAYLAQQNIETILHFDWLNWLNLMDGFSSDALDLSRFPPTLLIHGDGDVVVSHNQSQLFAQKLPISQLFTCQGAGHAPHWHDNEGIRRVIKEFLHV